QTVFYLAAASGSIDMLDRMLEILHETIQELIEKWDTSDSKIIKLKNFLNIDKNNISMLKNFPLKRDKNNTSMLHRAAFSGSVAVFERALEYITSNSKAYNPLMPDNFNNTILHYAAISNSIAMFERVLKIPKIDPLQQHPNGRTVLHSVTQGGSLALFERVLKIEGIDPLARDKAGRTILHYAAKSGSVAIFKRVLKIEGIEPLAQDNAGHTVLHHALSSIYCSIELLKYVLEIDGINISAQDRNGFNILRYPMAGNSVEYILYLYFHHRNQLDFNSFIRRAESFNFRSSEDMKKILLLIKDDIRRIDSKKAEFVANAFIFICMGLGGTCLIVALSLFSFYLIPALITSMLGTFFSILASIEFFTGGIRHIDTNSCFARFFRPPANPFEKYNYRSSFSAPSVAAVSEENQSNRLAPPQ
ncbi:MAG: ankyrin-3-like, partial [Gammaproteobacteria bacterium]|nr:ankyrin-3-like [Gammaproteobacteria bacterium]